MRGETPTASAISSTRTFSGPLRSANRNAASCRATRVACFFRSRNDSTAKSYAHAKLRARNFRP
ncbi:hypothetical protein Ate02nite_67370 [Paractinoplanes tereljensis]|uniref:Uncharacterized protein n=1 Tax=Paractinoplanes tereljensis TaxID=571912 RepID=A0A919TXK8_9ACTN|nr:hypothetical protein Ate02nite_67370 [Actinoplanes tereljensis]